MGQQKEHAGTLACAGEWWGGGEVEWRGACWHPWHACERRGGGWESAGSGAAEGGVLVPLVCAQEEGGESTG